MAFQGFLEYVTSYRGEFEVWLLRVPVHYNDVLPVSSVKVHHSSQFVIKDRETVRLH